MTKIAPIADRGTAKAAVDGGLRVVRSCGVTDDELMLTACGVDAGRIGEDAFAFEALSPRGPAKLDRCGPAEDGSTWGEAVADGPRLAPSDDSGGEAAVESNVGATVAELV